MIDFVRGVARENVLYFCLSLCVLARCYFLLSFAGASEAYFIWAQNESQDY